MMMLLAIAALIAAILLLAARNVAGRSIGVAARIGNARRADSLDPVLGPPSGYGPMRFSRVIFLCGVLGVPSSATFASDIFGLWHGVGIQGTQSEWSTEIDLRVPVPKVRYPSLTCSGEWQPMGAQGGVYEFKEVITIGRERCIDGFVKVFRLSRTRLAVVYHEFENGDEIARSVVFPGPHHKDVEEFMIGVTQGFVAAAGT